ncbi:hypothetical protein FRC18_009203 [Serendipita sp. 400]|nr:hypothetical protein FRC18_009203 [Serendipita sp. 400]
MRNRVDSLGRTGETIFDGPRYRQGRENDNSMNTGRFGNRYFENLNAEEEIPGRHRWVDLAQHEYNISQVPPEWHSWISHIRKEPPTEDGVMQKMTPAWKAPYYENLTGTRGAYRPYNTVAPKINAWKPQISSRSAGNQQ